MGLPSVLILEDNVAGAADEGPDAAALAAETARRALEWAEDSLGQWDVLHLALVHSAAALRLLPHTRGEGAGGNDEAVVRVERTVPDWYGPIKIEAPPGLGTTAYLVSRRAMERVVELDASLGFTGLGGLPIDDLLARHFPATTFAAAPAPLHRGLARSLINEEQQAFRLVMYSPSIYRRVEQALIATGLSTGSLVQLFLAAMAAWTLVVVLPLLWMVLSGAGKPTG